MDKKQNKNRLFENIISLSSLQFATYLLPLITVPYLVRVLGPEKFGLIAFAQALIQFFVFFTDYGFNLSATRKIAVNKDDKDSISRIFSSVMFIKTILTILSFFILACLVMLIPKFKAYLLVYFFSFGIVIGHSLFPLWYFQGIERMKYIASINVLARLIFTFSIFIFVRNSNDYLFVPILNSLGFIIAGIVSLYVVFFKFNVIPRFVGLKDIYEDLKEGWYCFLSTVSISFYTSSSTLMLGIFTTNTVVGYYSAAEKIIRAILRIFTPFSQSIYPYISNIANQSREKGLKFLKKTNAYFILGSFIISLFCFIYAQQIVLLLLGPQYKESILVFRMLAMLPFITGIATVYAQFYLLGFGYIKELARILLVSAFLNIILCFIFIHFMSLGGIGAALSWIVTELFVLSASYFFYRRTVYADR